MNRLSGWLSPQSPADRMVRRATRRTAIRANLHRLADRVAFAELSPAAHDAEQGGLNDPVRTKIRTF
jgi:hypothetical protein